MIDKSTFIGFVNQPQNLSLNDIMLLESTSKKYPYFQLAYTLIAKGIYTKAPEIANDAIKKAAVYALSRNALRKLIEDDIDWLPNAFKNSETYHQNLSPQDSIEQQVKQGLIEDDLINAISNSNNKDLQVEQLKIIENFIKNEPRIRPVKTLTNADEIEDLSESSTLLKGELITESYARILAKQGLFDKAVAVYQKLITRNPEKNHYFAEKIEELRRKTM